MSDEPWMTHTVNRPVSAENLVRRTFSLFLAALPESNTVTDLNTEVAVPTQCLYPSNGIVNVYISGGVDTWVVSDGGGTLHEIESHGLGGSVSERVLKKQCEHQGLIWDHGKIKSSRVRAEALPAAVMLVANTASRAAIHAVENLQYPKVHEIKQ